MRKAFVVTDCGLCLKNYFYIQIDEIRMKNNWILHVRSG